MSDDPCRAILRALAGLMLVEVGPMASEAIFLALGPGGTRSLINEDADIEVAPVDDSPLTRYRRERSGSFREGDHKAALKAIGTLVGQTVSSVEHGHHHRLTLRFTGGGAVRLRRYAPDAGTTLDDDLGGVGARRRLVPQPGRETRREPGRVFVVGAR